MNFRRTLRNTLLAGALALGFGSAARADVPAPNSNNLPVNAVSLVPRTVTRHVVDEQENLALYVTKLGGNSESLVALETNDPAVTIGKPYRVPMGVKDLIEIDRETNDPRYKHDISRSLTAPELINIGSDYQIWSEELPSDFKEGTFNYWTAARCWDPAQHYERNCASVAFPITVYRAPTPLKKSVVEAFDVAITRVPGDRTTPPPAMAPQCSDGKDNDGDGAYDYPYDPGCKSDTDNKEKSWRDRRLHAQNIELLPVHRELNALIGGGMDQHTACDSSVTPCTSLDFNTKSLAARYRSLGEKTKVDAQVAFTQGNDEAGHSLSAFNGELHLDRKLFRSNISPGISAAIGFKDVRTYTDSYGEDSSQGNGYGFLGGNVTWTAPGGFASQNFAVLRGGVVAQPIIDKKLSFGNSAYTSTTDMELAYPEFSLDARKSLGDRAYLDLQIRGAPKVETLYTSATNGRELTKTSEYLNLTMGLGYRFDNLDAYLQGKWAHNSETWDNIGTPARPNTLTTNHDGLTVRGGITWTFDKN